MPEITEIVPPGRGSRGVLSELWRYRDILFFLGWRDVKVRYKQALLGVSWAILQPLVVMVVFSVIFGTLAGLDSGDIPYPIFTFVGILPWQLFSSSLTHSSTSLVTSANLLRRVYFPRMTIPIAATLPGVMDFLLGLIVLGGMMIFYHSSIHITWAILLLPVFSALALLASIAVGLWLSAINVRYRDVKHIVPFIIRIWMYASPVAYSAGYVKGLWRLVYGLNPMAGVIQGFRWALLGDARPDALMLVSVVMVFVILLTGIRYFRKAEDYFADIV